MLGRRDPQRELFRPDQVYLGHVGADSFYGFLAQEGPRLFRDRDFAGMYGKRGRPSVPPSQLCIALLLQARDGVSDEEAIQRSAFDLRWKVALGIELDEKLCAKSTLQLFRAKLLLNDRFEALFETSLKACREAGLLRRKKIEVAIDTTPILGRGAVKDTFNLISDGVRGVVDAACSLKGWERDELIAEHGLGRHFESSFKGSVELDWSDRDERRALVGQLVGDARIALSLASKALRGYSEEAEATQALREARDLLLDLLSQDVEEEPEDGEGPQIRRGTARNRIISTTDPEMRHGHKSHSKGFDGYKASVVAETDNGVILSTDVRSANTHDGEGAAKLVEEASQRVEGAVDRVLGDTAYGGTDVREDLEKLEVEVIAKAPPLPGSKGTFKLDVFRIDEARGVATCPAGRKSTRLDRMGDDGLRYVFPREECAACELRAQCTTAKRGPRTITVTTRTHALNKLRRQQKTKSFRRRYRRRVVVEHRIARLKQLGIGKARYLGRIGVAMQVSLAAAVANLTLAAGSLGLHWALGFADWVVGALRFVRSAILGGCRRSPALHTLAHWPFQPLPEMALSRPRL